ncbi:hypothetical protein DMUE_2246 [Dictyocoela muelleri]|nr:hypothetical protein DMUE_2246 [Dictyocoela muelleri]
MEKFSKFSDRKTGINPFISKRQKFKLINIWRLFFRIPLIILYFLNINIIKYLIKIKIIDKSGNYNKNMRLMNIISVNSVSIFDELILKTLFPEYKIINLKEKIKNPVRNRSIVFIEETNSNGDCMLKFPLFKSDHVVFLKYNDESIFMYGSKIFFYLCFFSSENWVKITIEKGTSDKFKELTVCSELSLNDKNNFFELVYNNKNK